VSVTDGFRCRLDHLTPEPAIVRDFQASSGEINRLGWEMRKVQTPRRRGAFEKSHPRFRHAWQSGSGKGICTGFAAAAEKARTRNAGIDAAAPRSAAKRRRPKNAFFRPLVHYTRRGEK